MLREAGADLLIHGKLTQPDGTAPERYLLVRDGSIVSITDEQPGDVAGVRFVPLGERDWVFPGLLDLHTHAAYNLYPLWENRSGPYNNRFSWREHDRNYQRDLKDVHGRFYWDADGRRQLMISVFAELQAVVGGTTTLQETLDLDREAGIADTVLCRSTANARELAIAEDRTVLSPIDWFRPDPSGTTPIEATDRDGDAHIRTYEAMRDDGKLQATLVHLAEGRSGFGPGDFDPYTRAEFEALMAHDTMADADAVRSSPLTLIHGCGIDVTDDDHLAFLRDREISVIWSPVSNLLLYDQTIDMEKIVLAGVNVAIGSDWSPSGSKHVWDEAKFARFHLQAMGSEVPDAEIYRMVTANAARCLGLEDLGRLAPGSPADLMILRSPIESSSAMEVFFKTMDRDVLAVLVAGVPRYGQGDFLAVFDECDWQELSSREGWAVRGKRVHLPRGLVDEADEPLRVAAGLETLEDVLKSYTPPIERSNMLVSSDRNYRKLVKELRRATVDYGWDVEQSQFYWRRT